MQARRLIVPKNGGPDVLRVVPCELNEPGTGQVRVRGAFAGINFADLMMRIGLYRPKPVLPFTPGYEVSGTVDVLGPGVTNFAVGDRVVATVANGAQQTHVVVEADQLMLVPEGVSLEDAGAIPVTYLTAWHMLAHLGNLREGETVLIHGIAGGVGTAAMQIAKLFKAGVVYGTASPSKVDGVNERGGVLINRDNFAAELMRETKGRGVDHILDPVGGSVLRQSYKCLAPGGRLYTFGLSAAAPGRRLNPFAALKAVFAMRGFNLSQMMMDNRGVFGVHMGTFSDFDLLRGHLSQIIEHVVCGDFEPVIDSVFPLAESTQAHEHIHARRNVGKVLLDLQ